MAGKGRNQFGAFGGVFTPSILTILGVIMYLRLPWLVGQAGLVAAVTIVLIAHVISVSTGLSISSIATDKKVGAGGPYYIISRSLGLPIGGTLGFALFIGLSFSISLYIIGFTESFLDTLGWEATGMNIRVTGSVTLIGLTILTFISTSLALRSQYVVLALIVLSIVSILLGNPDITPEAPHMEPLQDGEAMNVLFGVFFPAVTGFTAGVNMSGDLKDPKKAIPRGTMAAIVVGLITYVGLAVFLSFRVDRELLLHDPQALTKIAWAPFPSHWGMSGSFVIAGIWGATLSSALGSILGAPRILQALSGDGVFFRFFAKGAGKTNEPRRALALAFCIAEAGILIGELNAIAAIVSMFFIAMYGFLNVAFAIESWASTDFRPDFKIPKTVGVIGFVTCGVLMIQLDLVSTLATVVLFGLVFWVLKRRELTLESGDTWEGVWSSVVRAGLERLTAGQRQSRNWRPNVLAFAPAGAAPENNPLLDFGEGLIRDRGVITRFSLVSPKRAARRHHLDPDDRELPEGVFLREVATTDRFGTMVSAMRFHGFSGIEPNTVLLGWEDHKEDPEQFLQVLDSATDLDFNLLVMHAKGFSPQPGGKPRIDIWWERQHGSLPLSLRLIRFLTSTDEWRDAELRFLFIADDAARADTLIKTTERLLADARIHAKVKLLDNTLGTRGYEEWVQKESDGAALVVMGLPRESEECDARFLEETDALLENLGTTVLIRGSSGFRESFAGGALITSPVTSHDALPIIPQEAIEPLELPTNPVVRAEVDRFARALESSFDGFWEACLGPVYGLTASLVERVDALVDKELGQLGKGVATGEAPRHRKAVVKARAALLFQARKILTDWEKEQLQELCDIVERRVELQREDLDRLLDACDDTMEIERDASELVPAPEDSPQVRKAKRRLRTKNALLRKPKVTYRVKTEALNKWYLEYRAQRVLWAALLDVATQAYRAVREVGKSVEAVRRELAELGSQADEGLEEDTIEERASHAGDELHAILEGTQTRAADARWSLRAASRDIARELSDDLLRFDVGRVIKKERSKRPSSAADVAERLPTIHESLGANLGLVIRRVELQLLNAAFQLRIGTIVQRAKEQLLLKLETGAVRELEALRTALTEALEQAEEEDIEPPRLGVDLKTELDARRFLDDLLKEVQAAAAELPESFDTVSDDALVQLNTEPFDDVDVLTLSLRRLAEFLVGGQFEEALDKELADAQRLERRAASVAHDVVRLVQFHLGERGAEEELADEDPTEQRKRLLDNGIARVDAELEAVRALVPRLSDTLDEVLASIIDRTDAYAIAGNEDSIRPYVSTDEQRRQALSWVGRGVDSARERAKDTMVRLLYRRSAGVLYARRLQNAEGEPGTLTERVRRVVDELRPSPEVLRNLPFHYQQLFLRQARIGAEFWVGRTGELAEAARAVRTWKDGARGALMVIGERHAGKSALCRQIGQRHFQRNDTFHVFPPAGGSINPAALRQRLRQELGARGELHEMLRQVADGSLIVMHDVELWWERADEGLPVVDQVQEIIDRHGDRLFFLLNAGTHAFRFLDRVRGLSDQAFAVIECQSLDAEALKDVITRRHRSTGLTFEVEGAPEEHLAAWQEARLFTRYFDHSGGRVGTALNQWIANIERIQGDVLHMRAPRTPATDVFRELKPSWIALLLELVLHRSATRARMERFTGAGHAALGRELGALVRSGLVSESSDGVLEVNRFAHHVVVRHLRERGAL